LSEGLCVDSVDGVVAKDICQGRFESHGSRCRGNERGVEACGGPNVYTTLFFASQFEANLWEVGARHDHPFGDVDVHVGAGWGVEDAGVGGEGGPQGKAKASFLAQEGRKSTVAVGGGREEVLRPL